MVSAHLEVESHLGLSVRCTTVECQGDVVLARAEYHQRFEMSATKRPILLRKVTSATFVRILDTDSAIGLLRIIETSNGQYTSLIDVVTVFEVVKK